MLLLTMVRGVGKHFRVRASEWAAAAILCGSGYVLALPKETFAGPSFTLMGAMAPESIWALGCIIVGIARLLALFVNGSLADTAYSRFSPHVRAALALASSFFWLQATLSVIAGDSTPMLLPVYPTLFAVDLYNAYRSSGDARHSDEDAKNAKPGGR